MRPRRARAGGHNCVKGWPGAAISLNFVFDFGRNLDLAHFWPNYAKQITEDPGNQVGRLAHPRQFVSVLHSAKAFDDAAIRDPADTGAAPGVEGLFLRNGETMR